MNPSHHAGDYATTTTCARQCPPGGSGGVINTSPMWAVVLAMVLLKERFDRYALAGTALTVAGIFVTLAFR